MSNKVMGRAIGLISLIDYLPDIFSPMINMLSIRILGSEWAHNGYFLISAAFGFIA